MNELIEYSVQCPYCGEFISIMIDGSVDIQSYIEDCSVCCRPIQLRVAIDEDGYCDIWAGSDNE